MTNAQYFSTAFAPAVKAFEEAAELARKGFDDVVKATPEPARKHIEDAVAFSKDNAEALRASGAIVAKGVEEFGAAVTAHFNASVEKSVAASQALLSVKSPEAAIEMSQAFAKDGVEVAVAETTKLRELSERVAKDALAPLSARYAAAMELFSKPLAA